MTKAWRHIPMIGLGGILLLTGAAPGQVPRSDPPEPPTVRPSVVDPATPLRPERLLPPADQADDIEVSAAMRALAAGLADPSYERREAAMQTLMSGMWDVDELCALLSEPLAAEQRYRLLTVLRKQLDAPRGAVGISMQWQPPRDGAPGAVEITDLVPGLPAEEVLLIGDHVTHIDGRPLNFMNDLRVLVQSRRPGEEITLSVRRARYDENGDLVIDEDGRVVREVIELPLRLGSAQLLLDPQTGRPTRGSPVSDTRDRETRLAMARYAPRPVVVEILGGEESGLVPVQSRVPVTEEDIEGHPLIQSLRRQQARIAAGDLTLNENRVRHWQLQLDRLNEMAARPGLSDRDIELLRRVARRFAEMMEDG